MRKLDITWDGTFDSTGYLFSFAKALSCAVRNSPYSDLAEDIVASSGFAFRMWIAADLCPSETSIWDFGMQPKWIQSGGLEVTHVNCCWQPETVLNQARNEVLPKIKESIDRGIPVVAWDIGICEWGLITGYDDETERFATLCINGASDEMDYCKLGNREMPMLNIIIITGKTDKTQADITADTKTLVKTHLRGEDPHFSENAQGLGAYKCLIEILDREDPELAASWNMEYALGTFGALKWYAWRLFEKYGETELAELYKTVYESWQKAFELKKTADMNNAKNRAVVSELLKKAYECENAALQIVAEAI